MAPPFFRETRAVQPRTVSSDTPCLKLSVDGYTYTFPAIVYVNGQDASPTGDFC